ncbi:MAG TPA: acyl-homoserine-lactone synthase [Hyphomonadaceae bacterium]
MIHAVSAVNQHLYARQLDRMFRMRHAFYVEGHGWADLKSTDGLEVDEFDDENAVYLMSVDPFGDVAAAVRLNPTTGPTLLGKFADHSDEDLPKLNTVWDISRWIAAPEHRRASNPRWPSNHQRELMVGILEFCQSRGLTHLTMLAELRLAERILAYGWPLRYLGMPREYESGKGIAVAAEIEVGHHVLALTRAKTGILGPILVEIDPSKLPAPAIPQPGPSETLRDIVADIGTARVRALVKALADDLAGSAPEERPQAIELLAGLSRLVEMAGVSLNTAGGGSTAGPPGADCPSPNLSPW